MSSRSVESGYSRLSDFAISCFRLLPREPSPRRPFVLRSRPPSRAGRTVAQASPRRRWRPSSCRESRGPARLPLLPGTASPSLLSECCRGPRIRSPGNYSPLAPQEGVDHLELELLRIAPVLPRPVYRLDPSLVDSLPPKLHRGLREPELVLQHGDASALLVPVGEVPFEFVGVILAEQTGLLTRKAPIAGAVHCLSNYRGPLQLWDAVRSLARNNPDIALSNHVLEDGLSIVKSVAANVRTTLQFFHIIDSEFRLTKLGREWIDDDTYPDTCAKIIKTAFPPGTYEALQPNGELSDFNRTNVRKWLHNRAGLMDPRKNASFLLNLAAEAGIRPTPIKRTETEKPLSAKVSITAEIPLDKLSYTATMLASVAIPNTLSISVQATSDESNR